MNQLLRHLPDDVTKSLLRVDAEKMLEDSEEGCRVGGITHLDGRKRRKA